MSSEGGNALTSATHSEGGSTTSGPAPKKLRTEGPKKADRKGQLKDVEVGGRTLRGKLGCPVAFVQTGQSTNYAKAYFVRDEDNKEWQRGYTKDDLRRFVNGEGDILKDRVIGTGTPDIKNALQKLMKKPVIDDKSLAAIQAMVPKFREDPAVTELRDALESGRRAQATLDGMRSILKDSLKCPITLTRMENPVICNRCWQMVDEKPLYEALRNTHDPSCPFCRAPTKLSLRDCSCGAETQNINGHSEECRDGMVMATIRGGSFAPNRLAREVLEMLPSEESMTEPDPE